MAGYDDSKKLEDISEEVHKKILELITIRRSENRSLPLEATMASVALSYISCMYARIQILEEKVEKCKCSN